MGLDGIADLIGSLLISLLDISREGYGTDETVKQDLLLKQLVS